MIEEKLKKAVQELPVPQSTFKSVIERAAQVPGERIGIVHYACEKAANHFHKRHICDD